MKKIILLSLSALPLFSLAQNKKANTKTPTKYSIKKENKEAQVGVKFIHKVTNWNDIIALAKKENKYIFLDCFTTWCGPCKYVSSKIFPLKNVGSFYNDNYINVKLQIDETAKDNQDVIASRKVAKEIEDKYQIAAYPTFLVFNSSGKLVHRIVGAGDDKFMIEKGKNALDPNHQFYTLQDKYRLGNKDETLLVNLIKACGEASEKAEPYLKEFINNNSNLYTKENAELISSNVESTAGIGFQTLYNAKEKWVNVMGKEKWEEVVKYAILDEVGNEIEKSKSENPDWNSINKIIGEKYPDYSDELITKYKVMFGLSRENWGMFEEGIKLTMEKYPNMFTNAGEYNTIAWAIFEHFDNNDLLKGALEWSKKSIEKAPNEAAFYDTYANLLYKLNIKEEAIEMETKAISLLAKDADAKSYRDTLDKMKKGIKTWK